ncbi:MAG: PfaD family polyunsaturated fatty acid/polyketide biosynthesis protein [Acidobacteriota bacterium]
MQQQQQSLPSLGSWSPSRRGAAFKPDDLARVTLDFREPAFVLQAPSGHVGVGVGGSVGPSGSLPALAALSPLFPEWLGDRTFCETHGVRFPYIAGAMANGIATPEMVAAMGRASMLGFFGAAGLSLPRIEKALDELAGALGDRHPWGSNLIHSPNEPALEQAAADLYIERGVRRVSASAFLGLTKAVVTYAYRGVGVDESGRITRNRHVFAKISHPEVARHFLAPAPADMLEALVAEGRLTAEEARLAARLPVAEDIIVESDSGGHTDNRPLAALFPTIARLRDAMVAEHGFERPIRIGAAGGLGTPSAVAAAFALGAAFVLTGSVNQACMESGLDPVGREMLARAGIGDVVMAPAADMFEQGVKVQVLQHGTLFASRARKLYELFQAYDSLEAIPATERAAVEKSILRASFEEAWASTRDFWSRRDPAEAEKADGDPRHRMALVFRSYLGLASRWAIVGDQERRVDYQIWCGPAMGAFNTWVRDSHLEPPENRAVVDVALNRLEGAAVVTRAQQLRSFGVPVPQSAFTFRPRRLAS